MANAIDELGPVVEEDELGPVAEWRPGEDWQKPIQEMHPDIGTRGRVSLKLWADAGPVTMQRELEKRGFETKHRGGMRYSIRRKGEREWRVVDPATWGDIPRDILDVIAPWTITGAGMLYGGAKGFTVGGVPGAAIGAGFGAAGAEATKQAAAQLIGYRPPSREVAGKIALEGVGGALGEVGGRLLPGAVRAARGMLPGARARQAIRQMPKAQLRKMAEQRGIRAVEEVTERDVAQLLKANTPIWEEAGKRSRELNRAETALEKARVRVMDRSAAEKKAGLAVDRARNLAARASGEERKRHLSAASRLREKLNKAKTATSKARVAQREAVERVGKIPEPAGPTSEREFIEELLGTPGTRKQLTEAAQRDPFVAEALGVPEKAQSQLVEEILRERALVGRVGRVMQAPAEFTERVFGGAAKEVGLPQWAVRPALLGGFGVTTPVAGAAIYGAKFVGKGLEKVSAALLKDKTGGLLSRLAARAKPELATKLSKPLQALRRGGAAYRAAIYTMLHDPDVREFLEKRKR